MLQPVAFEAAISLISGVLPMLSMKPDRTSMACSLCSGPALPGRTVDREAGPRQPDFRCRPFLSAGDPTVILSEAKDLMPVASGDEVPSTTLRAGLRCAPARG